MRSHALACIIGSGIGIVVVTLAWVAAPPIASASPAWPPATHFLASAGYALPGAASARGLPTSPCELAFVEFNGSGKMDVWIAPAYGISNSTGGNSFVPNVFLWHSIGASSGRGWVHIPHDALWELIVLNPSAKDTIWMQAGLATEACA